MLLAKGKRDFYAGGLIALIGAVAIEEGLSDEIGTLIQMGPGFMPLVLGIVLVILGIAIAASATPDPADDPAAAQPPHNDWRAWLCIIAGPSLFIVLGDAVGYVPATLVSVFVAALGDRSATLKSAATLSACVTMFGGVLFIYLLNVPFPLFRWGMS
jgi:putative Ca2+/H+ antiporter (TMEM165/GDT1 family)